jgi:DNA polymerase-3 subunit beta
VNIKVKRSDLLHALAAADGVARPNQIPLLECVLLTATGKDAVDIAATDTALTISATIASNNSKTGSIAMHAKRLRDVTKLAPDDTISIVALDNSFIEIKSGKANYKLAAYAGRDFPKIPGPRGDGKTLTLDGDVLKQLIDRTLFSASDDITRMHITGALLEVNAGVASMTSTDGHRLSRATAACTADDLTALIPKDALAKIARIAHGEVEIIVEPTRIFVRTDSLTMSASLIDAKFPPYDSFLRIECRHTIEINRADLIASIERTRVTTTTERGMHITGGSAALVFSSSDPDVGEVSDEIAVEGVTKAISSCVAPKYLLEPLSKITDDTIKLKMSGELDPIVLETAGAISYLSVVMPMRRS